MASAIRLKRTLPSPVQLRGSFRVSATRVATGLAFSFALVSTATTYVRFVPTDPAAGRFRLDHTYFPVAAIVDFGVAAPDGLGVAEGDPLGEVPGEFDPLTLGDTDGTAELGLGAGRLIGIVGFPVRSAGENSCRTPSPTRTRATATAVIRATLGHDTPCKNRTRPP